MADIDNLSIKISAEASTANKTIGVLTQNLSTLSKTLGGLNGSSLSNFSSAMKNISDGMKNLQGIKAKDFTPIVNGIQRFEKLDTGKIASVGRALQPLAQGINILSNTKFDNKNLQNLINSITRLSNANASGLANVDFTAIGNSIKTLTNSLAGAEKVQQSTISITNAMANLAKSGANIPIVASSLPQLSIALKNFINSMAGVSTVSTETISFTQAISTLANAGTKASLAAGGLATFAAELKSFMQVMATAPTVSNNIIQMTNALANLATQGSRVGAVSSTLVSGLNNTSTAMNRAAKSSKSLAAAFGKFYATWFLVIRGIKKLWSSIKSSMDYLEVLNYFNAAFEQVAENADLSSFQELGYSSAEEYAASFTERAKELTSQMTGFSITDNGTLEATGVPSLGLDPSQLMNYQAMFGQMASSMGVASETSLKLSQALTEIGADLASVKNLDFEDVWNDMASGLAGMSRTLDKYGVNIRNVNLQQKLTELGIDANITALNQNDKALLRTIILLDSTKYAWGDLADTINQPANQLRLITANFQNLARTIGNLFLPVVQKVLPYINALVIALQRLFSWIGNLLGIDLSGITNSIGNTDYSDLIEDTDDLTDGLSDAADAADKLKKGIRGFDELNVITTQDTSDSGTSTGTGLTSGLLDSAFEDALSEYQAVWDEAFANMENRAQELADKIEKLFKPIKNIIEDIFYGIKFNDPAWFKVAGMDTSNLVIGIFDFFANAIEKVDWYRIGEMVGSFLDGIDWIGIFSSLGNLIWQALKASIELWKGSFDTAPIETTFLSILALPAIVGFGSKIIRLIAKPFVNIANLITPILSTLGTAIGSLSAPILAVAAVVAAFAVGLGYVFATNEDVRQSFDDAINSIKEGLQPALEFLTGTLLPDLKDGWNRLLEILSPFGEFLQGVFTSIWQDMINPALSYIGETVLPKLAETFENLWNNVLVPFGSFLADVLEPVIQIISDALTILWENVVVPLARAIGNVLGKAFEGLTEILNAVVIPKLSKIIEVFQFLWNNVLVPIAGYLKERLQPIFTTVFKAIGGIIDGLGKSLGGLIDFIVGVFTGNWTKAWEGVKDIFKGIFNALVSIAEGILNNMIRGLNSFFDGFDGVVAGIGKVIGINISIPSIPTISLPRMETGGYFPTQYSIAMVGENGIPEIMGSVGGKPAVAGGAEITGIKDSIDSASQQEVQLLRQQNQLLQAILEKEYGISTNEIGKAARDYSRDYYKRTGKYAYSF